MLLRIRPIALCYPVCLGRIRYITLRQARLYTQNAADNASTAVPEKQSDPLRIAFFGTDKFTVYSLEALHKAMLDGQLNVERLDVITRTPKRSGRGRIIIKEAQSAVYADENDLDIIRADKSKEINELIKNNYNLAIAVSYGKLIPEQFIRSLKYGGLNVHPSLLPTHAGPAPIHHTIFRQDKYTGITVQTLDPTQFDNGRILYQTPEIEVLPEQTLGDLVGILGKIGAESLVHVLKNKLHEDTTLDLTDPSKHPPSHAFKLTSKDKKVDLTTATVDEILHMHRVMGPLHFFQNTFSRKNKKEIKAKVQRIRRIILGNIRNALKDDPSIGPRFSHLKLGQYDFTRARIPIDERCIVRVKDGFVSSSSMLAEGYGNAQVPQRFKIAMRKRGIMDNQLILGISDQWKEDKKSNNPPDI